MFCAHCGSDIQDDVAFCPNCGKPSKAAGGPNNMTAQGGSNQAAVYVQNFAASHGGIQATSGYPLSNLAVKLFRVFFEVSLWLVLVLGIVMGGLIGGELHHSAPGFGAIVGILLGGFVSFVIIIAYGGLVSLFIKLNDNVEGIKQKLP